MARGSAAQPRSARKTTSPHPATLPRGRAAQARLAQKTTTPHPATIPRTFAAERNGKRERPSHAGAPPSAVILRAKDAALQRLSGQLPVIDTIQLANNWALLRVTPPNQNLRLEDLANDRASAFWSFQCLGQDGHVSYNTGTYNVAHVTIRSGPKARLVNYWFQVEAGGRIVDAESRVFKSKETAAPLSKLAAPYAAPIRALLTAMYAGTC